MADRILIARIGAPHGVKGEVRLFSYAEDPAALLDYAPLTDADGRRTFRIVSLRPAKDHFVARLQGVDDRNAAEALTNLDLYVPRDVLPDADEDTFYHADLIGLDVEDEAGSVIGTVVALHDFGAGDVLEYAPAAAPAAAEEAAGDDPDKASSPKPARKRLATRMVPFTKMAVPVVDVPGRRVVVADAFVEGEEPAAPAADEEDAG